jgi:hypothetical protein
LAGHQAQLFEAKSNADNGDGSTGFRYAMLLGYIAFGKIAA